MVHTLQSCPLRLPAGTGPSRRRAPRGVTFVFVEQLVSVLDDFIILLQLQHALAVIQFQGDDHSTQINVVYVARHLLRARTQMGEEGGEGVMSCCVRLTSAACISIIRVSSGGLNIFTQTQRAFRNPSFSPTTNKALRDVCVRIIQKIPPTICQVETQAVLLLRDQLLPAPRTLLRSSTA